LTLANTNSLKFWMDAIVFWDLMSGSVIVWFYDFVGCLWKIFEFLVY
jgi:hypothetical protein